MSDDYCVYARSILGRLDAIANPTTGFSSSISNTTRTGAESGEMNMGLMMVAAITFVLLILSLLQKKKGLPQSKL